MSPDGGVLPSEELYFACHNQTDIKKRQISSSFACIFCGCIYHRSCIARKKNLIYLNGSLVVCCTDKLTSIQSNQRDVVEFNQIKKLLAELERSGNEFGELNNKLLDKESKDSQLQAVSEIVFYAGGAERLV